MSNRYRFSSIAKRLKEGRKNMHLSQERFAEEVELYGSNTDRTYILALESGNEKPWKNIELGKLISICDALGTDVGHLLGEYEASSNLVYEIAKYTGLSVKAIEALHYATLDETAGIESDVCEENKRTVSFINRVLERVDISGAKDGGRRCINNIFVPMEEYVCSTGAWIEDKHTGEQIQFLTVNYTNSPPSVFTVRKFLSSQLFDSIRNALDSLRHDHDSANVKEQ